jgi:phosphoglycerol transferase
MFRKIIPPISLFFFLFIEIFLIKAIPVLKETFPLENTEAVLFTLSQNIEGSRDFVVTLFIGILKDSLITTAAIVSLFSIFFLIIRKLFHYTKLSKISYNRLILFVNLVTIVWFAYTAYTQLPIIDYYLKWQNLDAKSEHSEFYAKEYIDPDSVQIGFKEKRNLILIFLESMEYNFQDSANGGNLSENLIPEITEYIKNEQSFIPGGTQAWGMGWTMADAVAKTCGIPLTLPPSISGSFKPMKSFLPGATCLTDILIRNDYNVVVSKGANIKFSGMDDFLHTHSSPQALGLQEHRKKDYVKKEGVRDQLHYELVKEQISHLAKQNKPWAIWFFTVDTHTPYGYLDPECFTNQSITKEEQFPYVVKCASKQLKSFIDWAKTNDWYNQTTIAVMGDHAAMAEPEIIGFKDLNLIHYWLDFFINSAQTTETYKRLFTSLDFFPTILESIGAEISGRALGLGRSLYSSTPTLLEKYGLDSLNAALKKKSIEYDYFLYFDKK